ncbi:MAG: hypothetical protein U0441_36915 [Polyangiaceae bacterium]
MNPPGYPPNQGPYGQPWGAGQAPAGQPAYGQGYAAPSGQGGYGQAPSGQGGYGQAPSGQGGYGQAPTGQGYGQAPSGQGGYGPPSMGAGHAPPGGGYGSAAYAPPREVPQDTGGSGYGDAALEHLYMKRGRYSAWVYVVLAYIMEAFVIGCLVGLPGGLLVGYLAKSDDAMAITMLALGVPGGFGLAYLVFRDRWRVNEAFSSRFCVGIMNISIMFVPLVSFVYANVRGVKKLMGT